MNDILRKRPLIFYDIEVFKHDVLIIFKDINKNEVRRFVNNFDGLGDFLKLWTVIGYNNHHYDDKMLTTIVTKWGHPDFHAIIKGANDDIIVRKQSWKVLDIIESLDCFQQIDPSMPSLKMIEANMGLAIEESRIPFDIDRPLTPDEMELTISYCSYDVDQTIEVYKMRDSSYFTAKSIIMNQLVERGRVTIPEEAVSNFSTSTYKPQNPNTTSLSAKLIMGRKRNPKWSKLRLNGENDEEKTQELLSLVPEEVREIWTRDDNMAINSEGKTANSYKRLKKKHSIYEMDCKIEFSGGGLHGVNFLPDQKNQRVFKNLILLDVASMYPRSIELLNALGKETEIFSELIAMRLSAKRSGNKVLANALKLVINSVYGLLKAHTSLFFNPRASMSVCVLGQLRLYQLCQMLYNKGYKLVNINTDGVGFVTETGDYETYKQVWKEWEAMTGYTLEADSFDTFIQKDVNNYIGVKDGKLKLKGGDVSKGFTSDNIFSESFYQNPPQTFFKNNSCAIVDEMVVNKLVYNRDYSDTILANVDKPIKFQYILKCGSTFLGTIDDENHYHQKVNRVFATKEECDHVRLWKAKDIGDGNISKQKFPSAPPFMLLWNGTLIDKKLPLDKIDFEFYQTQAEEIVNEWTK